MTMMKPDTNSVARAWMVLVVAVSYLLFVISMSLWGVFLWHGSLDLIPLFPESQGSKLAFDTALIAQHGLFRTA